MCAERSEGGTTSGAFRLLTPLRSTAPQASPSIILGGKQWTVVDQNDVRSPTEAPAYVCVSYVWGADRVPNPFDADRPMSSRAIPALEVTIAALDPDAIWLDSVCVPSQEPVRTMCLRSMGAIYAAAKDVVAVLSIPSSRLLDEIRRTGRVDRQTLLTLEHDEWVSRAWTYQEIANSQAFEFLSEGH